MNIPLRLSALAAAIAIALASSAWAQAPAAPAAVVAAAAPARTAAPQAASPLSVQVPEYAGPTQVADPLRLAAGKSALVRVPGESVRISIGNPEVADVVLINPREIYVLGKKVGSTNVFVWAKKGPTTVMDVTVGLDTDGIRQRLAALVPGETGVSIESVADSVVLTGRVNDSMKVHRLVALAETFSGRKVVNMLSVDGSQQVMLEVKIAEVSRTLLDKLGVEVNLTRVWGSTTFTLLSNLLTGASSTLEFARAGGNTAFSLDAEAKKGLVKVLAEPTIMAVSGQEGAFLAGGKIFIPVPQSGGLGYTTIVLEEKEFGVGLRFTPTVLEDKRINLRVTPEVSELSQVGIPITLATGQVSILPSITTRRASTTVQLRDGETFAIGGLIRNNVAHQVKALPVLGEIPVLGALFRSTEFQNDRSELLFIVTPRLVVPLAAQPALPTDAYRQPNRGEYLLGGQLEGRGSETPPPAPEARTQGFQLK